MDYPIARVDADHRPVLPVEQMRIPHGLSGAAGTNRAADEDRQIDAEDDLAAIGAWLARYAGARGTLAAYRKEAERLLLWAVVERGKPMSSLSHEDMLAFQRFLENPVPASRWIIAPRKKPGRTSPAWRPFAGPLSQSSIVYAQTVLRTMFGWMVDAGYLKRNPLSLGLRGRRKRTPGITRYLTHELWGLVKTTIESMPTSTERERLDAARCRWLFTVLYLAGLRASEIASTTMGAIFHRRDSTGAARWWIEVCGKGGKTRFVPASAELMEELARYRRANGLSPEPARGESRPLLLPLTGRERTLSRGAVHLIVKAVFTLAADDVRARGPNWHAKADLLARASAHWIRHTAGSHMTDGQVDLRFVRDNLGHASLATTSDYLHTEDDLRHEATQRHHRMGWSISNASGE